MWDKSFEGLDGANNYHALDAGIPANSEKQGLADEPVVQPGELVDAGSLVKSLRANLALTILVAVGDGELTVHDRLDNEVPSAGYQKDQQEGTAEIVKG